jgi:oligopeptide transport system ATP-binding protein
MLSIMGLLPQPPARVKGHAYFQGTDLLHLTNSEMRSIRGNKLSMIFQDPMTSLNPVLTTGLQTMEPLQEHLRMDTMEARERAVELLSLVGIPFAQDRLSNYPFQFSGGMRQRAMIAMALACNPHMLIADEPTTALDVTIQAQIVELVKELRNRLGMSLVWITHDLGVVAGLADRVLVMYAGYIVEQANVFELYNRPLHPYTVALLRSIPSLEDRLSKLESIEGAPPDLVSLPQGCPFAPRCNFVMGACRDRIPDLFEIESGHWIACHADLRKGQTNPSSPAEAHHDTWDIK